MASVEIVQFEPWHLDWLQVRSQQQIEIESVPMKRKYGLWLKGSGPAVTVFAEGVVCCAGVVGRSYSRGEVWSLMGDAVDAHKLSVHRAAKHYVDAWARRFPRLEMVIDPRFTKAVEWSLRLGFKYESTKECYEVDGTSRDMYVRITK